MGDGIDSATVLSVLVSPGDSVDKDQSIMELETDLFPCLVDMKFKGVRVDVEKAAALKTQLTKTEKELHQDIKKLVVSKYLLFV